MVDSPFMRNTKQAGKKVKKNVDINDQKLYNAIKGVMSTEQGRDVLVWVLSQTGNNVPISGGSTNDSFISIGKKWVGDTVQAKLMEVDDILASEIIIRNLKPKD